MKKLMILVLSIHLVSGSTIGQVTPQSGTARFSLPMFDWKDDKSRLNSLVALNYSSGTGLKVNDIASNVGQGWNMIVGGVITRIQAGEPDDQKPYEGNGTIEDETKYPPGYLYNTIPAANGCPNALVNYPIFEDKNHVYKQHNTVAADRELDRFAFQINGRSSVFVLGKNNADKGILIGDSKLKIWFTRNEAGAASQGIRTTIDAFYIQDENGLIYKFKQKELTKVLKVNYCDANATSQYTQPTFKRGSIYHEASFENPAIVNPYIVNGWYLTQIEDALTHRIITFNYAIRDIDAASGITISHTKDNDYTLFSHSKSYALVSHLRSITKTPVITSIDYPDGHQVVFNYDMTKPRPDLNGDYPMASVDITYQGRYLSKYLLNTSYFMRNRIASPGNGGQKNLARLCLLSVQKIGVDLKADELPYFFDYYTGSSAADDYVPPPFFHKKDIWGYFNGNNSLSITGVPVTEAIAYLNFDEAVGLCFEQGLLNAKPDYAQNGLLKQIVYPTGGVLKYDYEQNTGILNGQITNIGGIHVSKTTLTDGGESNSCSNPIVTNYKYVKSTGTDPSLWGTEMPQNVMYISSYYAPEDKKFKWTWPCCGKCYYKYKYPGIPSRDQSISITSRQQTLQTISQIMDVVGAVMQVVDVVVVALGSTGYGAIIAVIIDAIADVFQLAYTCLHDYSKTTNTTISYNYDLNSSNPLPAQYNRVEVIEGSGGNGKSVMEFTDNNDYPLWDASNQYPLFTMKQRYASWVYGLPKKTSVYGATGNLLTQSENQYDFDIHTCPIEGCIIKGNNSNRPDYSSCKCAVTNSRSQESVDWVYPDQDAFTKDKTSNSSLQAEIYHLNSGRTLLKTNYERVYKTDDPLQYLETKTDYDYSINNYQVSQIKTTLPDGLLKQRTIKYSGDFADYCIYNGPSTPSTCYSAGILNALNLNNIISEPVESTTGTIRTGGSWGSLDENVTEFIATPDGNIKPLRTIEQRFSEPQSVLKPDPDGSGGYVQNFKTYVLPGHPDNPAYTETQRLTYDASGNLIGMKDEGNHVVTNVYGYNDKYIVASVINADPAIDKSLYTSFETGGGLGGWTLSGSPNYTSASAVTGSSALTLNTSTTLSANLNSKYYKLSFWASTSGFTLSGANNLLKSGPTINGFTYYEYRIIAQATGSISISGTATIDELRLYPETARMRTLTYDPLIGKTSECDENNRITYYDYDELGRLKYIKDESKNIVKMYEYNFKNNKQKGCTTTYSNYAITQTFTKNNCAAGYIGSDVDYVVPAGKYTSTISQAVVDNMAQKELDDLGQGYANTNGTCILQYSNVAKSQSFTKETCPAGYLGGAVTYAVPTGRYKSIISQADADQQAQYDIDANGQAYVNKIAGNCVINTQPDWIDANATKCELNAAGTAYTGNLLAQFIDKNPNSSTYNTTRWDVLDNSYSTACTGVAIANINIKNFSSVTAILLTFTNKADGRQYSGIGVPLGGTNIATTVPAGVYDISISPQSGSNGYYCYNVTGSITTANTYSVIGTNVTISSTSTFIINVYNSTTFNSIAINSTTGKSDCPAGYAASPSTVVYKVPAGKYTSTISQADANAKAQADAAANSQAYANANSLCTANMAGIYLTNNSGYNGYTWPMYVDGTLYNFPTGGVSNALAVFLTKGTLHTFKFPCGPTSDFARTDNIIGGYTNAPLPASCGNTFSLMVTSDITFSFYPTYSQAGNIYTGATPPSGFCCHGCSYTYPTYSFSSSPGIGTKIYSDINCTQPITASWLYPYNWGPGNVAYQLNNGVITSATSICQ